MRVACVIPVLNEAARIESAVQAAWTAGADEVIVSDGGSTDGTVERARELNCRLVTSEPGRARQQNAGAAVATGDVLLFQHADNWLEPGSVEQIRSALADPRVLHGGFRQRIDADGVAYRLLEIGNASRVLRLGVIYGDQSLFVRRETFFSRGGFAEVKLLEDLLLSRQLRRLAWPVLLPGRLHVSARRWQRHGVVRQTLRNWSILTAEKLGLSPDRLAAYYRRHDAT